MPIDEEDMANSPITAIMTVLQGKGNVENVTTELKYLISSTWDWQVKKIAHNEFMFVVPSAKDLDALTRFTEFKCKISGMLVSVEKSDLMAGCSDILTSVWVQVMGVPYWARKEVVAKKLSYLVGDHEETDKKSLPGLGPIRIKVSCKDPSQIRGTSKVYFNKRGFKVSWLVESDKNQHGKNVSRDRSDSKGRDEEEEDSEYEGEDELADSFNPFQPNEQKEGEGQPLELSKQGENKGKTKRWDAQSSQVTDTQPKSSLMMEAGGGTLEKGESIEVQEQEEPRAQKVVCTLQEVMQAEECVDSEGPLGTQSQNSEGHEEEALLILSAGLGKPINSQEKETTVLMPPQAERKSSRRGDNDTPVLEKAKRARANKDSQGINHNPFSVLQDIDNSHLANLAAECGIVLGDNAESIDNCIESLKAKEWAQAEISRLEKEKSQNLSNNGGEITAEEDDECDEGGHIDEHVAIIEELTKIEEGEKKDRQKGKKPVRDIIINPIK